MLSLRGRPSPHIEVEQDRPLPANEKAEFFRGRCVLATVRTAHFTALRSRTWHRRGLKACASRDVLLRRASRFLRCGLQHVRCCGNQNVVELLWKTKVRHQDHGHHDPLAQRPGLHAGVAMQRERCGQAGAPAPGADLREHMQCVGRPRRLHGCEPMSGVLRREFVGLACVLGAGVALEGRQRFQFPHRDRTLARER